MLSRNESVRGIDRAALVAFGSAAMFGFGPVSVGYFMRLTHLQDFSASVRVTGLYFLAVYLVVAGLGAMVRARTPTIGQLWKVLPARARALLALAALSNAVSGWCFFAMLDKLDPLSAAVIMALTIVFNFFAARLLLGEEIGIASAAGRRKWLSFVLIIAGVLIASLHSSLSGATAELRPATPLTLLIGVASSLFAALRTVGVKGAMNDYPGRESTGAVLLGLPLAVTRFIYLFASIFTLAVSTAIVALDPALRFTAQDLLLPSPFLVVLGLVYGGAYALNYIAMSRIEASRMALITRSAIAFTALYMIVATLVFGYGSLPSIIEAPAALLVVLGSYLATRPAARRLPLQTRSDS